MDPIMEIAKKYNLKVIEDVSHAQGALYKGKKLGTIGDVGAMSLMSGKSLAIGEAGIIVTDDKEIYGRCVAFGHYDRFGTTEVESLKSVVGLPLVGYKGRVHQVSSAVGRVQLKYYDARAEEIRKAMNYFWDGLEGTPGLIAHRPAKDSGSTMGGWYAAHGIYDAAAVGGMSVTRFCQAVTAEGCGISPGCNAALHTHELFKSFDVYGHGKPTRIAHASRDVRELDKCLPHSEAAGARTYSVPWFKHFNPGIIDQHVAAFKKVCKNYKDLLPGDPGNPERLGMWHFFRHTS